MYEQQRNYDKALSYHRGEAGILLDIELYGGVADRTWKRVFGVDQNDVWLVEREIKSYGNLSEYMHDQIYI